MKTIYKLYDLKFVSCTKKEFDNLLTSEIRDDCAYIINDNGKITIHLNSAEEKLRTWLPLHRDPGKESFAQSQDESYTGIKIKSKNPDAYKLDNTLTDNEVIGSLGDYSSSFGGNTQAKGKRAMSTGTGTLAKGNYSHSEGSDSVALGSASHVEGYRNTTGPAADSAHAEGGENVVTANRGHAEGYHNTVSGANAHAEGGSNIASAEEAHVEGLGNIASGKYSHAEGQSTVASGEQAHSEGSKTKAVGDRAHAEGDSNESNALNSHSEGSGNKILTSVGSSDTPGTGSGGSTPSGDNWSADDHLGVNSHVEGSQNLVYGYSAHGEGANNKVKGHYAHSEGAQNTVDAEAAHAEGLTNTIDAKSTAAHAEGYNNSIKEAIYTHVEGMSNSTVPTKGSIRYGHIEGYNNKIISNFANNYIDSGHVEGTDNIVSAGNGHAEGSNTQATGINSHAQNSNTVASGPNSTAIGSKTTAAGESSFAGGLETVAKDTASLAFGTKNTADGWNATTFGSYNKSYIDQFIIGKYAKNVDNPYKAYPYPYFAIGNGSNESTRQNAFTVYREGFAEVQTQGTTDNSVVIKKNLDELYTNSLSIRYPGSSENIVIGSLYPTTPNILTLYSDQNLEINSMNSLSLESNTGYIDIGYNSSPIVRIGAPIRSGDEGTTSEVQILNVRTPVESASSIGIAESQIPYQAANKKYVDDSITKQISSVYKAKGSIANISALAAPSKAYDGFVYNIETEFTTTDNFVEGKGKKFPAGTNIVCINTTGTTYKWDVLAGIVDLSNYQAKLVSGTNIKSIKDDKTTAQSLLGSGSLSFKTINNQSILGSGNITIEGGSGGNITVDAELSKTSTNPVQNSIITTALYGRQILFADIAEISVLNQGTVVERIKELRFTDNKNDNDEPPIDSVRFYNSSNKPVILHGISAGELDTDAVNISQLNKKQDVLTSTTDLAIRSVTASNVSTKLLQSGTDALQIVGSEVKLSSNDKKAIKITNLANGTANNDAINKGQLDTAVANKQDTFSTVTTTTDETTLTADKPINITTNKYSMVYDDTNEAIKITFA